MNPVAIHGFASSGFEAAREAFVQNFSRRNELGAACCIYQHGEKVVDLWGGIRNKATGEPWEEDTMVVVYSTTKGHQDLRLKEQIPAEIALDADYKVERQRRAALTGLPVTSDSQIVNGARNQFYLATKPNLKQMEQDCVERKNSAIPRPPY